MLMLMLTDELHKGYLDRRKDFYWKRDRRTVVLGSWDQMATFEKAIRGDMFQDNKKKLYIQKEVKQGQ